jgi:hypothetical protein
LSKTAGDSDDAVDVIGIVPPMPMMVGVGVALAGVPAPCPLHCTSWRRARGVKYKLGYNISTKRRIMMTTNESKSGPITIFKASTPTLARDPPCARMSSFWISRTTRIRMAMMPTVVETAA